MSALTKIPTLNELVAETEDSKKEKGLLVLLNQNPPDKWLKTHPLKDKVKYLPIERVEYLLNRIYGGYKVEVKNVQVIANSVQVTVRLHVTNPLNDDEEWQEGVGAWPIQVNKGAKATDFAEVKSDGVQLATPAAKTEAIKDAAHHFGRLFGRDVNRSEVLSYDSLLPKQTTEEELKALYESKKHLFSEIERKPMERIIINKEVTSYDKLKKTLEVTILNINNPQTL